VVVLLNDQEQVIYQKRLPNHPPAILEPLRLHHGEIEGLVVESTYNWYWLVDGLMEAGYRVHLANPAAMQQYSGLKYSDDHWGMFGVRVHVELNMHTFMLSSRSCRANAHNSGLSQQIGAFCVSKLTMILSTYPTPPVVNQTRYIL